MLAAVTPQNSESVVPFVPIAPAVVVRGTMQTPVTAAPVIVAVPSEVQVAAAQLTAETALVVAPLKVIAPPEPMFSELVVTEPE